MTIIDIFLLFTFQRNWVKVILVNEIINSKNIKKELCFSCKLFKSNSNQSLLAKEDLHDWKHIAKRLKTLEKNVRLAYDNMNTWIEKKD